MTQKDFAEKISVSRPFISRVESDKEKPSDSLIKLMCFTFNISYDWLKYEIGEQYQDRTTSSFYKYLKYKDNFTYMANLLGTTNYNKTNSFVLAVSMLANIYQNTKIKDNSYEFFYHNVILYVSYLQSYCISSQLRDNDAYKSIFEDIIMYTKERLTDIGRAFEEEDLDEELKENEEQ